MEPEKILKEEKMGEDPKRISEKAIVKPSRKITGRKILKYTAMSLGLIGLGAIGCYYLSKEDIPVPKIPNGV